MKTTFNSMNGKRISVSLEQMEQIREKLPYYACPAELDSGRVTEVVLNIVAGVGEDSELAEILGDKEGYEVPLGLVFCQVTEEEAEALEAMEQSATFEYLVQVEDGNFHREEFKITSGVDLLKLESSEFRELVAKKGGIEIDKFDEVSIHCLNGLKEVTITK